MSGGERSSRTEVRNPILGLPAMRGVALLPPAARSALAALLADIRADAAERAQTCWKAHKAPMAAYWKAVSVYAGHIRRAVLSGLPEAPHALRSGEELQTLLTRLGLSHAATARMLGYDERTVRRWVHSASPPPRSVVLALAYVRSQQATAQGS